MIKSEFVSTKIGGRNIKHYKSLGYVVRLYDVITVPVDHLPEGSHEKILVQCDFCKKNIEKTYRALLNERKKSFTKKDCCCDCIHSKGAETNICLYGVDNAMKRPEISEKLKDIFMEKYGVENPTQDKEIRARASLGQRNMSLEDKEKRRQGTRKTVRERYGVDSTLQLDITRKRLFEVRSSASSQQIKIFEMLKNIYGKENVTISYSLKNLSLDVVVLTDNFSIDIEYDSWYWHNPQRDRRRDEFVKSQGFSVLRIKSSKLIPSIEELVSKISYMRDNKKHYSEIVLRDWNQEMYEKEDTNEFVSNNSK